MNLIKWIKYKIEYTCPTSIVCGCKCVCESIDRRKCLFGFISEYIKLVWNIINKILNKYSYIQFPINKFTLK